MRPQDSGGATPMTPKKGRNGISSSPRQAPGHGLGVEAGVDQVGVIEVLRQGAAQGAEAGVAPVLAKLDILDAHLQHVAGSGAAHRHRAGQDVPGHGPFRLLVDLHHVGKDGEVAPGQHAGLAGQAVHGHRVPRVHLQHRRERRLEVAPMDGGGRGGDRVMPGHGGPPSRLSGPWSHPADRPHRSRMMPRRRRLIRSASKARPNSWRDSASSWAAPGAGVDTVSVLPSSISATTGPASVLAQRAT